MFEDNKIGFAIQSRLGSNRLPGKALLYYGGSTVLGFLIKSLLEYGVQKESLCVATSTSAIDDVLAVYTNHLGCRVVRGDENNVFSRYQKVAAETGFKNIVRLTGDNPCVNFNLLEHCLGKHIRGDAALTTTRNIEGQKITRYVPKGFSIDIINSKALLSIDSKTLNKYETEHVIPHFFSNFKVQIVKDFIINSSENSVDTIEDYVKLFKI